MRFPRFYGPVAGAMTLALVAAACGGGASQAPTTAAKPYIAIVSKGSQHQFWQAVQKGATDEAAAKGATITYEGPASESEVDKQLTMLQTALDKKPAAVCFAALDSKAAGPLLQKAKDAGIPVIGFDSGVDSDIPVTTVSTDNIAAAGEAADQMAKLIGNEGKVAVIVHDQTSQTGTTRRDGFVNRMKEKYPNIEVVAIEYGAGDPVKSADLAKAIMTKNPDLKGFFGANEGSAKGVLNALKEAGKEGKIVAVGYDSGQQQIEAIRSGVMAGAITQNPVGIGAKCVDAALDAIAGKTLPKNIDTGYYWYDKTNIDNAEVQAVLYQ
ncbi:MAG TPA: ABC transporter substrate-binding protein [Candidatus Sulfomarinibacteraceae bacterium]|nr:ABC transporter substrate-binding protein [Candidatus Sulfomarinibacteraceae bacterium]